MVFALFPGCEVLNFAGPLQAFCEANVHGARYSVVVAASSGQLRMAQLVTFSQLPALPVVGRSDLVIVPGFGTHLGPLPMEDANWLRAAVNAGAHICGMCAGVFALGEAGLLNRRRCTTHKTRLDELQRRFPAAHVQPDRLFVSDGPVTTSAGAVSSVDMALWFIEQHYGPLLTAHVARAMLVYLRRDGAQPQESVYLDHRTHVNSGVHRAQDYLVAHADEALTVSDLAEIAGMSVRTLTRAFRISTGLSITDYRKKVRLETARILLRNPDVTMESVAEKAGFSDSRHFRRVWKKTFGVPPSVSKREGTNK